MVRPIDGGIDNQDATRLNTQSLLTQQPVDLNDGAGADSLRGELLQQQSIFRFKFLADNTNTAGVVAPPVVDQQKVEAAVKLIKEKLDESGIFNDVTHSELQDIERTVSGLTNDEAKAVFDRLSDGDLRKWTEELGSNGWFGTGGFDGGEMGRLFQMLAGKLDGRNLARFSAALEGDNVKKFGEAIGANASDAVKEEFIRSAATRAETDTNTALAVAEVLASMKNNPAALQRVLGSLSQTQLNRVIAAATQKQQYTRVVGGGYGPPTSTTTVMYDAAPLGRLLDAVAATSDPKLKATVFESAALQLKEIESAGSLVESLGGVIYFKGESVSQIRNGLTAIINSDTTGVVGALETTAESYTGAGLTAYLKSMLGSGQEKQVGEMISRMLLGNDLKGNAVQRFRQQTPGNTGDALYDNAENLGYFLGATRAATRQLTDDTGKQADFVKNIFGAVLSTAGAAGTGAGLAATGVNWLSGELINRVAEQMKDGRTNIYNGLVQLGLPRVNANTIYDGPAEEAFKSGFSFVVDNS